MIDRTYSEMIIRLPPYHYAHITNENSNTTELIIGPQTRTLASDENLSKDVTPFHIIPRGYYCCIENPYVRDVDGITPVRDNFGQVKVHLAEREFRYNVMAFPLYPEEKLLTIEPLEIFQEGQAILLRALREITSSDGLKRKEGEYFLFTGPGIYYPRVEEEIIEERNAIIIPDGNAIHLKALKSFKDENGIYRQENEEYLRIIPGFYICSPSENFIKHIEPILLGPGEGLHVKVLKRFMDERKHSNGKEFQAGQIYLITHEECPLFILHPYEKIEEMVKKLYISKKQYVILTDPKTSRRRVITNDSFYPPVGIMPERIKIHDTYILSDGQAILLKAIEDFKDTDVNPPIERKSGDLWLLKGPKKFIPNIFVKICDEKNNNGIRERFKLCDGEGIYVRNITTGAVRSVNGPASYMLDAYEELWEKTLSPDVEKCLEERRISSEANVMALSNLDSNHRILTGKTHYTVMYKIPHRSVTQVYNYRVLTTRTIFGPDRVLLEPDEEFTVVTLSGSPWNPKNPHQCLPKESSIIKSLHLFLGPSNMTDIVYVETRDHAQLALQLCYAWYFDVTPGDEIAAQKCFTVNDFVGDAISFIAGRIRAAVASLPFQQFHKNSSQILKQAVFGFDTNKGIPKEELRFDVNNFVVTSVDTQRMEVLDPRTREGLKKSVKIAIEISTQAQESNAQQIALAREQQSGGLLEKQKMQDQVENETQRRILLEAQSRSLAMISSGRLKSITDATAKASAVENEATTQAAEIRAKQEDIMNEIAAEMEQRKRTIQYDYELERIKLAQVLESEMANIENDKFASVMEAIGPDTVKEIAKAGPEMQAKLLNSLGLEGYLVMDGTTPMNLFRTAAEMTAQKT